MFKLYDVFLFMIYVYVLYWMGDVICFVLLVFRRDILVLYILLICIYSVWYLVVLLMD